MKITFPQTTNRICPECNSAILLVDKKSTIEEGQFNPVVTSYYECSNKECSDEFKKREVLRRKKEEDRVNRRTMSRSPGRGSQ